MSEDEERIIRDGGLAFYGKIVAGQSHEVTNVLNIINELTGLQQDLLKAYERSGSLSVTRLQEIGNKICKQVERGERIIKNINSFAHSVDYPHGIFDIKESLSNILFLAERWTRLRKVELTTRFPKQTVILETSPFFFMQVVFLCIDSMLLQLSENQKMTVGYLVVDQGAEVFVDGTVGAVLNAEAERNIQTIRILSGLIGGELRVLPVNKDSTGYRIFVPGTQKQPSSNSSK